MPGFGDRCSAFDKTTGPHDSSSLAQAVETNSIVPGEVLPVLPKKHSPVQEPLPVPLNEALSATCTESLPTRICQTDGAASTPERFASPETSQEKTQLTSETPKSTPARRGRPRTPAHRPNHSRSLVRKIQDAHPAHQRNHSGSLIRKIHDAHRGGFRRSPRAQLLHQAVSKEIRASKDRALVLPSPLKSCDNASDSQQPVASNFHRTPSHSGPQPTSEVDSETTPPTFAGTGLVPSPSESSTRVQKPVVSHSGPQRTSKVDSETTPPTFAGTELAPLPSESSIRVQNPVFSPPQTNCDCLQSALRMLEELETRNHRMQDFSAWVLSQHLASSLGKCIRILECKACIKLSEQMMLMTIIAQKITKMFNKLATRFVEQKESIVSSESSIPLPRLVLIQQLRLERVLNHLEDISRSHNWQTHLAIIHSELQYSKDIMNRLRDLNRHH